MRTWRGRWLSLAVSWVMVLSSAPPAALGQEANEAFPPVAGGGAPAWVAPGLRLSYYGEAASIRTSYYTYVEAEDGEWEDPVTHKRYRRTEEAEMPEAAGRAFTQSDVIALAGDDVIMTTTMVGIDFETGLLSLIPLWGGRYPGAAVDGAWVRPDLLATVASGGTPELRVLRGPYDLEGTTVDAIGFMARDEGTYASTVFDQATGMLVASTGRAKGPDSPVHGPLDDPEGNVTVSWSRSVGVRQRGLPGIGEALPDWVAPGLALRYVGTTTVTNPFDPGFEMTLPLEMVVTVDEVGEDWATFQSRSTVDYDGYLDTTESSGATGAAGQYWYVTGALGQLAAGDVLDEDPVTGARLTVDAVDDRGVTLRTEMPGVSVLTTFDSVSGVLTAMTVEQGYATVDVALASIGG
jgi:hypothetical protein